jgi:phosphatidylserine decarboxylase
VISALIATVVNTQLHFLDTLPLWVIVLMLAVYYYDPDRKLPSHPLGIMCPIDGIVTHVELFHDPIRDRPTWRIRIRADIIRVYYSRSPTEGKLMEYWPQLQSDLPGYKQSEVNGVWWIQTDEKDDVVMVIMSPSKWPVRASCKIQAGERIGQGRRCGRFPLFCDVDVLIPDDSFISSEVGQSVRAGVDVLATLNHERKPEST